MLYNHYCSLPLRLKAFKCSSRFSSAWKNRFDYSFVSFFERTCLVLSEQSLCFIHETNFHKVWTLSFLETHTVVCCAGSPASWTKTMRGGINSWQKELGGLKSRDFILNVCVFIMDASYFDDGLNTKNSLFKPPFFDMETKIITFSFDYLYCWPTKHCVKFDALMKKYALKNSLRPFYGKDIESLWWQFPHLRAV